MLSKLYRRHPVLLKTIILVGELLLLLGWIVFVSPDSFLVEVVFVLLVFLLLLTVVMLVSNTLKWRIATPVVLTVLLVLMRLNMLDLAGILIGFGVLGLVAFIN